MPISRFCLFFYFLRSLKFSQKMPNIYKRANSVSDHDSDDMDNEYKPIKRARSKSVPKLQGQPKLQNTTFPIFLDSSGKYPRSDVVV